MSTGSISDAFSDLGPTNNAPLPALGTSTPSNDISTSGPTNEVPNTNLMMSGVLDSNVGSMNQMAMGDPNSTMPTINNAPTASLSDSDAFSGMQTSQDAPLGGLNQTTMPSNSVPAVVEDDGDDFGDFEGVSGSPAPAPNAFGDSGPTMSGLNAQAPPQPEPAQVPVSDAFGALVDVADVPLPGLDQMANTVVPADQDEDNDDFGGFEAAPAVNESPGLGQLPNNLVPAGQQEDDDDFGGFEAAPAANELSMPAELATQDSFDAPTPAAETFGGFESYQPQATEPVASSIPDPGPITKTASISDAFGDIDVPDAPLPSLDQFSNVVSDTEQVAADDADEDDDFGGFEEATGTDVPSNGMEAPDANPAVQDNAVDLMGQPPANDDFTMGCFERVSMKEKQNECPYVN